MKNAILTMLLLQTLNLSAQWNTPTFIKYYYAPFMSASDYAYSVVQTDDGGFAFLGESVYRPDSISYRSNMILYKTNNAGVLQWQKVFDKPLGNTIGYSVRQLSDGSLILCGTDYRGLFIIKTNEYGDTLWTRTYSINIGAPKLQLTLDNGFIVAGTQSSGGTEVQLIKLNANGNIIWNQHYDWFHYADLRCYDVERLADSGYVLTGTAFDADSLGPGAFFIRTDKNGDTLWSKLWHRTPLNSIRMRRVIPTADGGFIATGGNVSEGIALKMDGAGNQQWVNYIPGADGMDIYEDTGKGYYIYAHSGYRFALQKLNLTGDTILWSHDYLRFTPQYAETFARTREGGFIMTGYGRDSLGHTSAMLVKVDSAYYEATYTNKMQHSYVNIDVFPNPANTTLTIFCKSTAPALLHLCIFDHTGKTMMAQDIKDPLTSIPINTLPNGLYLYSVTGRNEVIKRGKLQVEH